MPAWWSQGKRAMTISESRDKYPDIPHSWLCDSKLLRLLDPTCPGNLTLFKVWFLDGLLRLKPFFSFFRISGAVDNRFS